MHPKRTTQRKSLWLASIVDLILQGKTSKKCVESASTLMFESYSILIHTNAPDNHIQY